MATKQMKLNGMAVVYCCIVCVFLFLCFYPQCSLYCFLLVYKLYNFDLKFLLNTMTGSSPTCLRKKKQIVT